MSYKDLKWTYSYPAGRGKARQLVESGLIFDTAEEASAAATAHDRKSRTKFKASVHPYIPPTAPEGAE